ncbi:MAG TPA: hypothetical protein VFC99_00135, partial [Acidimicrobiia bacterium]|nr:hypothetical protein [Acidimicrobiia bacterium]
MTTVRPSRGAARHAIACIGVLTLALTAVRDVRAASFIEFESGLVRPLALTPDGSRLLAVNTPDARLQVFAVSGAGLSPLWSVPVGMEPVAVAARSNGEAWVVNHLSDSVSIVDLTTSPPHVIRTLVVGDEPRDVVFAGPGRSRAFITTAHRGQQRTDPSIAAVPGAGDPQLTTPGVGRADVWVFDATNLGTTFGGTPLQILTLFTDTPRALAVSTDGNTVYAAGFETGNQTTTVGEGVVCDGFQVNSACSSQDGITSPGGLPGGALPGGNPGPAVNRTGVAAPEVGLIVKYNKATGHFEDELGRNWTNGVRFTLPDRDVFAIDATTLAQVASHVSVGTTLFNMVVNPANGKLYVSNTDAKNLRRFEGPGDFGQQTVQGHLAEADITVVENPNVTNPTGANVKPRHLNKHIGASFPDYSVLASFSDGTPNPSFNPLVKDFSLALPTAMAVSSDGTTLYVAAFGSAKVGVFDTASLENDTFDPLVTSTSYIPVSGGGPAGLALDEARGRLYVLTRFDDAVSSIDVASGIEVQHIQIYNPEPASVVSGRPFLYDANFSSANGEASCASCHTFGDMDQIAWDLGNPDDDVHQDPMTINLGQFATNQNGGAGVHNFHPMKGPMTTQTLRGLVNSGPMHWRGDRSNGFFGLGTLSSLSFNNFIVAFQGLLGRASLPSTAEMNAFTTFALQITLPPNPVRDLHNTLNADQAAGASFFSGPRRSDGLSFDIGQPSGFTCNGCHTLNPGQGLFGTSTNGSFEGETQTVKVAH